jgi:peptidylprolyl isomerase/peptidyl-prolyl cis-trans isomerase D
MAILSKIREKSVFLIVVVGLALFAFVLDPATLQDFFGSSKINEVGEVDGETISRQEYADALETYKANVGNRVSEMQSAKTVWDNLLNNKIYTQQLEEAGITIGENDIWNRLISDRSIQSNPQFQNELGIFDEDKLKLFILEMQEDEDQSRWKSWQAYLKNLETQIKKETYNNLVNAGLGASLKEGKYEYEENNTFFSGNFVYVPFSSITDSVVKVDKSEIEAYIKKHPREFETEAKRDLTFVKFEVQATQADKDAIKASVAEALEDKEDESGTIAGFKNTTDYLEFFDEFESDFGYREQYRTKTELPKVIAEDVTNGNVGDVFGPYEERNVYKLTKIVDIVKRPDSVKSSHILIPYIGSGAANAETTRTEEEAKKSADSILQLVRRNKTKFAEVADEINTDASKGKGGDIGWISHSMAFGPRFDDTFAEFIFDNRTGKVDVIKTPFGYHVVRIDEQKNTQNIYKVVTYGKQIVPSEQTGNDVFQEAEKFALAVSGEDKTFYDAASEKDYRTYPAIGLKVLDGRVPSVPGDGREIVKWAFDKETEVGDFRRFDVDNGFVVAMLTGKQKEGLETAAKAASRVRPILINQKKAELIKEKMTGSSLEAIATANNTNVRSMTNVTLKSPAIPGVGSDASLVGAMYYAKENQLYQGVTGKFGVFSFVVTKKEKATELTDYEPMRQQVSNDRKNLSTRVLEALKESSDIKDNRAVYHGVNQ